MILSITALIASILALSYQIYTTREQDRKWDEYFENEKKRKQMIQEDEDEIIIEYKGDRETYITFKQQ
jgi:hypothetical protein